MANIEWKSLLCMAVGILMFFSLLWKSMVDLGVDFQFLPFGSALFLYTTETPFEDLIPCFNSSCRNTTFPPPILIIDVNETKYAINWTSLKYTSQAPSTLGKYPYEPNDACAQMLFTPYLMPKSTLKFAQLDKIYIIHWTGNPSREPLMEERLDKILPPKWRETNFVSFVKKLDASTLNTSIVDCFGHFTPEVKIGSVSVTAKHHLAYYDVLRYGYQNALILEDDVEFDPSFNKKIIAICDALQSLGKETWSNCFISGCIAHTCPGHSKICPNTLGGASNCAYGYLVSNHGAKQHIDNLPLTKEKLGIHNPDWVMNILARNNKNYRSYLSDDLKIAYEKPVGADGTWNFKKKKSI